MERVMEGILSLMLAVSEATTKTILEKIGDEINRLRAWITANIWKRIPAMCLSPKRPVFICVFAYMTY